MPHCEHLLNYMYTEITVVLESFGKAKWVVLVYGLWYRDYRFEVSFYVDIAYSKQNWPVIVLSLNLKMQATSRDHSVFSVTDDACYLTATLMYKVPADLGKVVYLHVWGVYIYST